jgi:hypothetical protein
MAEFTTLIELEGVVMAIDGVDVLKEEVEEVDSFNSDLLEPASPFNPS